MRIVVNGKPVSSLARDDERGIPLEAERAEIVGSILTEEAATTALRRHFALVCAVGTALFWLLLWVFWIVGTPMDRLSFGAYFVLMAIVFPIAMAAAYHFKVQRWIDNAPQRAAATTPAGTEIRTDAAGLTVGGKFFAWRDLLVDRIDLGAMSGEHGRTYFLQKLTLRGPDFAFVLDPAFTENGAALASAVYRRLCRPILNP